VSTHPAFRAFLNLNLHEDALRMAQRGELPVSTGVQVPPAAAAGAGGIGIGGGSLAASQAATSQPVQFIHPAAGAGAPSELPAVETARVVAPADNLVTMETTSAVGVAEAPPAAHDEYAAATTQVDVRLPSLMVPHAKEEVEAARSEMLEAQREKVASAELAQRSSALETRSEALGAEASNLMRAATGMRMEEEDLKSQAVKVRGLRDERQGWPRGWRVPCCCGGAE